MQLPGHWQTLTHGNVSQQSQQKEQHLHLQSSKEHSSQTERIDSAKEQHQHVSHQPERDQQLLQVEESHSEHQQRQTETNSLEYAEKDLVSEQNPVQDPSLDRSQNSESQHHRATPQLHNQQVSGANDANSPMRRTRAMASIPLDMLIPILSPNLDKDRAIQLSSVFNKLRTNEISKENFLRVMRTIVGDQMVRQAADKVQLQLQIQARRARDAQTNANQYTLQARAASHQRSSRGAMLTEPQLHSHISSATQPLIDGVPTKTPPRKLIGQKKPLETGGALSPLSSKKQKTLGAFLDQSIEQLNDVTSVSGVNIQEEEEQLLSAPKVDSRAAEGTRRVVQEEEDRLILQKGPLQKKN